MFQDEGIQTTTIVVVIVYGCCCCLYSLDVFIVSDSEEISDDEISRPIRLSPVKSHTPIHTISSPGLCFTPGK